MENLYKYISFDGYRNDSPDRYNPVNIIPTGRISMRDVNYPVFGIDEYGNGGIMYPGNDYQFTGNTVLEIPMMQRGGQPVYDNIPSPAVMRSKAQADHEADIVLRQKALQPITKPVIDFMQEWMSSPMYKAMLQKSNGSSIAKGREKQLQTMRAPGSFNIDVDLNPYHDWVDNFFVPRTLGSYGINTLTGENKIYIDKKETDPKRRKEIAVHELSHATDNPNGAGGTPLLPAADIAKMQAYRAAFDKTRKSKPEDWQTEFYNYLAEPTETRARLNTLRYLGKQKGIYDPFTEKIDKNKLDKFNSLFSNDISLRQLREIYSDEQITDMLNSISKVPSVSSIPLAKGGGQHGGLDRWFAEKWVDVKTGKECGRQEGEKRKGYPACRPSKKVSADTPKTASELSSAEKARFKREKTSSKRINYNHKKAQAGLEIPQPYIRPDFFSPQQIQAAEQRLQQDRIAAARAYATPATGRIEGEGLIDAVLPVVAAPMVKAVAKPIARVADDVISNAWKVNPRAYQYNLPENTMWRGLGKEGMEDALQSRVFRAKQDVVPEYYPGTKLRLTKSFGSSTYFTPKFKTAATYGDDFLAEVPRGSANWANRYKRSDWSQVADRQIPITEGRILQKDWLKGYKPVQYQQGGELELAQYGYMIPPAGFNLMLGASELYNYFFGDEPKEVSKPQVKNVSPMGSMYQLYNADLNQFKSQKTNNDKLNQNNSGNINLSSGRFQGAQVSPEVIKEAVASAKAQGIDPWLMLSVIGRESTFGSGTDANIKRAGSKSKLVSGWDVAENYTPYDPLRFLADKKVPGVSTTRDAHGWHYKLDDKAALNKYLSQHPELVAQYQKKVESTPELGNLDSFDLAAKFIKERGLARYNPGDPNYSSMVNQDMKLLQSDPKLKAYMKTLGYENGGELFDMKSGGNVPTNPSLWSKAKAAAKAKYDVYPSAYANGFAAKWYKQRGGSWKKAAEGGCFECGGQFAEGGVNYNDMLNQPVFIPTNFVQFGGVANPLKQLQNMDMGDKIQLAKLAMMFAEDGGEADGGMALTQVNAMIDRLNNLKNFITPESDLDPWISDKISVMNHSATAINDYMQYGEQEEPEEMREGGGIPTRYKNMGFSKVGVKKESSRPGKKWMVLAKKGDDYKVVHGGYDGMKDFSQHGSEKRKDRFWDRMGGKDSAKAKDPFSPLYWHKKFGTWAEGGEPQNEGFKALSEEVQNKILKRMIGGGEEGDWMTIGKTTNRNIAAYQDKPTRSMVNFGANTTLNPTLYAIEGMDDKGFFGDLAAIALGAGALNNVGLGYRKLLGPASKTQTQMNTKTGKMVTSNLMDRDSKKLMNQWEKSEFYQEPVQDELRRKQKMNLSVPPTGVDTIPMDSFENMAKYGGYYVSKMLTGGQPMLSKDEWMQQNGRGLMGQELQDEKDYQAYVQQWQLENENSTTQQTPATTTTTTPEVTTRLGKSKMIPNLELDPEGQALAYGTISAISTIANRKNRKDTLKEYEANLQKYGNTDFRFDNNYVNRDMFGQYTTNRAQGQNFILNKTTYAQDMGNQFNYGFGTNFKEGGEYDLTPQQIAAIMAAGGEIEFID